MEWTLIDWRNIFEDEASDRTAVIISAQPAHFLRDINLPCDFDQCGVVETCRYERYNGYHYSIIQFADAASATNLLRKRYIVVRGVDFIVEPFHSIDDLIKSLQCMNAPQPSYHTASDNSDRNILHYLNDDCLGEIFRRIHSLFDVVSIENVCTRFRQVAATAFIPLLKRKQIDFTELKPGGNGITVTGIETFLRRHGSAIVSVQLCENVFRNMSDVVNPILKLLQRHCANLKSLTLHKETNFMEIQDQTLIDIRPLLSKLTYVEIWHHSIYGCRKIPTGRYVELITACTAVETLIVNIDSFTIPEINFPKLKVFQTNDVDIKLDQFISKNRQIEALNIPCKPVLLRLIAENMPKLRKLFVHGLPSPFRNVGSDEMQRRLKHVNISIRLINVGESVTVPCEIENIASVQLLVLQSMNYDLLLELTKRLRNLESLSFIYLETRSHMLPPDVLTKMLQNANKLTKLRIKLPSNYTIDYPDYNEILQIVENRTDPLKLNIVLDSVTERWDGEHGIKTIRLNLDRPQWLTVTKRYLYLTRRDGSAYNTFQRQIEKKPDVQPTHVIISSLPSFGFVPSTQSKIKFNVI